ncbi:LOW QUALITY PROTEIN: hypothetical protein NC652_035691 [Populus alba x Populus x berolinensis]|nr:LOW QUALITY PROTEIN: hypothetical protein NC652_035691 [Populus alba x Populus x berolinensis]
MHKIRASIDKEVTGREEEGGTYLASIVFEDDFALGMQNTETDTENSRLGSHWQEGVTVFPPHTNNETPQRWVLPRKDTTAAIPEGDDETNIFAARSIHMHWGVPQDALVFKIMVGDNDHSQYALPFRRSVWATLKR